MKYKAGKGLYRPSEIARLFSLEPILVYTRFKSKYAHNRWGVEMVEMPDGTYKRFVPEDKLVLWKNNPNYKGRLCKNK
jgi:hypothetical protein